MGGGGLLEWVLFLIVLCVGTALAVVVIALDLGYWTIPAVAAIVIVFGFLLTAFVMEL